MFDSTCIEKVLCNAKCCAVSVAEKYVHLISRGEDASQTLSVMNKLYDLIKMLECYDANPIARGRARVILKSGKYSLASVNILLSLVTPTDICLDPDKFNFIKKSQVDQVIEYLSIHCSTCNC